MMMMMMNSQNKIYTRYLYYMLLFYAVIEKLI